MSKIVTAALVVIGNEILSGRTQDKNINSLAKAMTENGIRLSEVRIVPDIQAEIVAAVNACRSRYNYLFTSGGIGPTHDDITADAIAAAFGTTCILHPEAEKVLHAHYGDEITDARLRMGRMPASASLIPNAVSGAPGFCVENVYVMAGVPSIFNAMLDAVKAQLKGGKKLVSHSIAALIPESALADALGEIQQANPAVDIGSYPQMKDGKIGVSVVVRGEDASAIAAAVSAVRAAMEPHGQAIVESEL